MRHGNKNNNLGRKKAHREALLSNLAIQLITHKRIVTTLAKAKALRTYVEPLVTKTKKTASKEEIMHNHRVVFSYLNDKTAVKELFTVVAPKIAARPGGYTRIIKLGIRPGDNAEKAMIELVDFNEIYGNSVNAAAAAEPAKKTRRSKSAGTKKADATEAEAPAAEAEVNTPAEDVVAEAADAADEAVASVEDAVADAADETPEAPAAEEAAVNEAEAATAGSEAE